MRMRLVCLGDVMLGRGVSEALSRSDPESVWGDCLAVIHDADLRLANLECCVSDRGEPFQPPRVFSFRAIPKAVDVLRAARIDLVTLANNHSLDYGAAALVDTLERLDRAGIAHVGAGRSLEEAARPALLAAAGAAVGVIGFTDNYPEYAAWPDRPGTFHVEAEAGNVPLVAGKVRELRRAGADLVIVTAHWGPNMRKRPPRRFVDFARAIVDAGADLWFGHSAHIFQGVEFREGRPIVYDGGDFVDDYAVDPVLRNDRSLAWRVTWEDGKVTVEGFPVQLSFARTNLARGEPFDWVAARLEALCAEMGTAVARESDRLVLAAS